MSEKLPMVMVQSFSEKNGKTAELIIESEHEFPSPPFVGQENKTIRGEQVLNSKKFKGTLKVAPDHIQLDNCAKLHPPVSNEGNRVEQDFILTITLRNGEWFMHYVDKTTREAKELPFHGFMYND